MVVPRIILRCFMANAGWRETAFLPEIPTHISSYMWNVLLCIPRVAEKFIVRNHGSILFALNFYNALKIHFLRQTLSRYR